MTQNASFDPRSVPVTQVDTHLAAPDAARLRADALLHRFAARRARAPELAVLTEAAPGRALVPAAVLVPVVQRNEPTVLLTQRTQHLSSHSGQIAFPGGKSDAQDADAEATALREAYEEVGLAPAHVQVLGRLPQFPIGTGYLVTPVVALVRPDFELQVNTMEVEAVFEVPLAYLMDPANHRHHATFWQGRVRNWISIPYHDGTREWYIWGATAGMLRVLYEVLVE